MRLRASVRLFIETAAEAAASYPHVGFFFSLFVAVCNAAYLHSFSGVQSVSDTVLVTSCCRAPKCATSCIKTCVRVVTGSEIKLFCFLSGISCRTIDDIPTDQIVMSYNKPHRVCSEQQCVEKTKIYYSLTCHQGPIQIFRLHPRPDIEYMSISWSI